MKRPKPPEDRYVLYCDGHLEPDLEKRTWIPIFFDPAVAHACITKLIGNVEDYDREGDTIRLPDGFTIRSEQLDDILAAEPDPENLRDDYARNALRFRMGSWEEDHTKSENVEVIVDEDGVEKTVKAKKPKAEKPKRATKPEGYVTITELCKKWKIKPLHARQALRAMMEKPEYGWAFDPKREAELKKICGVK